jgi:hypothetical protein
MGVSGKIQHGKFLGRLNGCHMGPSQDLGLADLRKTVIRLAKNATLDPAAGCPDWARRPMPFAG